VHSPCGMLTDDMCCGHQRYSRSNTADLTFRQFLDREGYSQTFIRNMIVPTMSGTLPLTCVEAQAPQYSDAACVGPPPVLCTCSYDAVEHYPADIMLDYLERRSMNGTV